MTGTDPAGLTIGVDIGGTKIVAGVVDESGTVLALARRDTPAQDVDATERSIVDAVEELRAAYEVDAVGIGAAGWIDASRSTVLFAPNLAWRQEPLRDYLERAIGLPVVVENDANAGAWGEFRFGAAAGVDDSVLVTFGTGIGGGIVIGGQLYRGSFGIAGEFGHVRVERGGRLCGCGNRGCWEQYASGRALVRAAREALGTPTEGDAPPVAGGAPPPVAPPPVAGGAAPPIPPPPVAGGGPPPVPPPPVEEAAQRSSRNQRHQWTARGFDSAPAQPPVEQTPAQPLGRERPAQPPGSKPLAQPPGSKPLAQPPGARRTDSVLLRLAGGDPAAITGPLVTEAALAGDPVAVAAFAEVGRWVGEGVADLAAALDPAVVVIGGGLSEAGDLLLVPAQEAFRRSLSGRGHRPEADIRLAKLGNRAGMVGAADLARLR
ncbi:MAG TPA: ROK family protein [Nocardioidaceae bacterium]|nr:ROK family protein [Nocardioidaceae bacterium]